MKPGKFALMPIAAGFFRWKAITRYSTASALIDAPGSFRQPGRLYNSGRFGSTRRLGNAARLPLTGPPPPMVAHDTSYRMILVIVHREMLARQPEEIVISREKADCSKAAPACVNFT